MTSSFAAAPSSITTTRGAPTFSIRDGAIVAIGANLEAPAGAEIIDAGGCYVLPGGIDPHTHLELAFMGAVSADDFEWGTKAALVRRHHHGGRFLHPQSRAIAARGLSGLAAQGREARPATTASTWR